MRDCGWKGYFALCLALALACGLIPQTALAETVDTEEVVSVEADEEAPLEEDPVDSVLEENAVEGEGSVEAECGAVATENSELSVLEEQSGTQELIMPQGSSITVELGKQMNPSVKLGTGDSQSFAFNMPTSNMGKIGLVLMDASQSAVAASVLLSGPGHISRIEYQLETVSATDHTSTTCPQYVTIPVRHVASSASLRVDGVTQDDPVYRDEITLRSGVQILSQVE